MKKLLLIAAIIAACVLPTYVLAVESVITQSVQYTSNPALKIVVFNWTASSISGSTVTQTPTSADITKEIEGSYLVLAKAFPGAILPFDQYDITITDQYGFDIMGGSMLNSGATRALVFSGITVSGVTVPYVGTGAGKIVSPSPIDTSGVTLVVSGVSVPYSQGTVILYFSRQK